MLRTLLSSTRRSLARTCGPRWLAPALPAAAPRRSLHEDRGRLDDGSPKTVVAVLYSAGEETARRQPKLLACAENGLGLREWLESQVWPQPDTKQVGAPAGLWAALGCCPAGPLTRS